jgi:hypothetical protein
MRDFERTLLVPLQPDTERPQAARRQPGVVRGGGMAEIPDRPLHALVPFGIGGDRAEEEVGMAADIFAQRLDADVDAMRNRREEEGRRPGIVEQGHDSTLPSDCANPGHEIWKRDFKGSSGLFSFELKGDRTRFVEKLQLFGIGYSWGGYESLVVPVDPHRTVTSAPGSNLVRLHIGLEDVGDLIADLAVAFDQLER